MRIITKKITQQKLTSNKNTLSKNSQAKTMVKKPQGSKDSNESKQKKSTSKTKVAKKKTATTRKKRAPAKKKVCIEIPEDKFFVLINGEKLTHYIELADKLENMPQQVLAHHITPFKHDFATWVRDVFGEEDLAKELESTNEPEKLRTILYKHLVKKHLR